MAVCFLLYSKYLMAAEEEEKIKNFFLVPAQVLQAYRGPQVATGWGKKHLAPLAGHVLIHVCKSTLRAVAVPHARRPCPFLGPLQVRFYLRRLRREECALRFEGSRLTVLPCRGSDRGRGFGHASAVLPWI